LNATAPSIPRIITIVARGSSGGFDVHEGEGYANGLCWDEMLGTIAELTHHALKGRPARYFQMPAERDAHAERAATRQKEREAQRARVQAERAALPTIELRALHCFIELHGHRDILGGDWLLPIDQQPPDVADAMRKLAEHAGQPS
jgi:hypothetical protein